MIYKRLDWDSDFFNLEITEVDYSKIRESIFLNLEKYDLIYLYNCFSENFCIPNFEQKFQETKVIFSKTIYTKNMQVNKIVKDYDFNQLGNKLFYPLAFESGKHSRFKLDAQFKEIKFRELYIKWVDNSLNKEFADKVFYINQQHKVVGFVTVKKYEKYAKIGLIAIDPNSQGKGYGSILIEQVEKYCIENKLIELQIPTQKENLLACKFYTKLGYSIIKEINIKHFWRL